MWKLLCVAIVLACTVPSTFARHSPATKTIGYWANMCDYVVRGVITHAELIPSTSQGATASTKLTIQISEVLIGSAPRTLTAYYSVEFPFDDPAKLPPFALNKNEQLFFIEAGKASADHPNIAGPFLVHTFWFHDWDPVDLTVTSLPRQLITDDLRLIDTPRQLLDEVRAIAKLPKAPDGYAEIWLPEPNARRVSANEGWLDVGLNEQTFATARRWLQSPDPVLQWCGVEVLVHQRTPENAELLAQFARKRTPPPPYTEGWYSLLDRLFSWGVRDLPSKVTPSPVFHVNDRIAWVSLAGFISPAILYLLFSRWWGFRPLLAVWWLVVAGLIVVGVRSYQSMDAAAWKGFELAFENGRIYLENKRPDAGQCAPLVFCRPTDLLKVDNTLYDLSPGSQLIDPDDVWIDIPTFAERYEYLRRVGQGRSANWLTRLRGPTWQLSIWWVVAAVALPQLFISGRRCSRAYLAKTLRGFPVQSPARYNRG